MSDIIQVFTEFVRIILHLDAFLVTLHERFGPWIYLCLFLIVFCETGLVVTPFLPGDSLLFAAGTLCALPGSHPSITLLIALLIVAACLGDFVNYNIGRSFGIRLMAWDKGRFIKESYMEETRRFFEKHGGKAVIFARFAPIIRTYAPFMAGIAEMKWRRFMAFNVVGGVLWVVSFSLAGFFFGNLPGVQRNLHWLILAIVVISLIPVVWQFIAVKRSRRPQLSDV